MKTQALARLVAEASATYQDVVNHYQANTNLDRIDPRFSAIQSDIEPLLNDLGLTFNHILGKLFYPMWASKPDGANASEVVKAMETKGFKFKAMPLNPTLQFAMMSHQMMPKYGGMVTAVVKVWHTGVTSVGLTF